jgi:hypothetical protein
MSNRVDRCIFCKSTDGPFSTREHILPESLGGGEWAILPPGLFCDSCQNVFGSSIEQQAVDDYPFNLLRVFLGIPTKKGKPPWFKTWEGRLYSNLVPGQFHFDDESPFTKAVEDGTKTQLRIIAQPKKPDMVCRALLKMGLEVIAADNLEDAFAERFDAAREFALRGIKAGEWWYLQIEDHALAEKLFLRERVDFEPYKMELCEIGDGNDSAEVFHLRLFFLDMMVPMESRIIPDLATLPEPQHRLFKC